MYKNDMNEELLRNVPPVGVSTMSILGIPLNDLVYLFTILYLFIQIVCLMYKTFLENKRSD